MLKRHNMVTQCYCVDGIKNQSERCKFAPPSRRSREIQERGLDMTKHALKLVSLLSVALAMALFVPQRAAADDEDPPARVARLSYTHGAVSFQPAGTDEWVSSVVNRPMTT